MQNLQTNKIQLKMVAMATGLIGSCPQPNKPWLLDADLTKHILKLSRGFNL